MSKRTKWSVAGALILVIGVSGAVMAAKSGNKGVEVRIEAVEARDLVASVTASGQVRPQTKVDISSDITGKITQLAVREGQMVSKGQLLVQIDPEQARAAVDRVTASLASARAQAAQARACRCQRVGKDVELAANVEAIEPDGTNMNEDAPLKCTPTSR